MMFVLICNPECTDYCCTACLANSRFTISLWGHMHTCCVMQQTSGVRFRYHPFHHSKIQDLFNCHKHLLFPPPTVIILFLQCLEICSLHLMPHFSPLSFLVSLQFGFRRLYFTQAGPQKLLAISLLPSLRVFIVSSFYLATIYSLLLFESLPGLSFPDGCLESALADIH